MTQTCWQVLGIEPTESSDVIERAYLERLQHLSDEDDHEQRGVIQSAYESALAHAIPTTAVTNHSSPDSAEGQPIGSSAVMVDEQPRSSQLRNSLVFLAWIIALFIVVKGFATMLGSDDNSTASNNTSEVAPPWDERLLACNEVANAEVTDAFTQCLTLAEEGWEEAQRRIAWSYTRDDDTRDWSEAYNWVKTIAEYDREADFLANVILFVLGEDEASKLTGERRIKQKANIRYAPAEAYLATIYGLGLNQITQDARIIWLLESAYENDERLISAFEMAQAHVNGFGTRKNLDRARAVIEDYSESDMPFSANNAAWFLATTANNQLFQPETAIALARKISDDENQPERYSFVDTLAAAYAASGDFEQATLTQEKAIELLRSSDLDDEQKTQEMESYSERLSTYQNNESVTYDDLFVDASEFFDDLKSDIESLLISNLHETITPPKAYQNANQN